MNDIVVETRHLTAREVHDLTAMLQAIECIERATFRPDIPTGRPEYRSMGVGESLAVFIITSVVGGALQEAGADGYRIARERVSKAVETWKANRAADLKGTPKRIILRP